MKLTKAMAMRAQTRRIPPTKLQPWKPPLGGVEGRGPSPGGRVVGREVSLGGTVEGIALPLGGGEARVLLLRVFEVA